MFAISSISANTPAIWHSTGYCSGSGASIRKRSSVSRLPNPCRAGFSASWKSELASAAMTRILHILDHSLPLHSGYTFRTRAILKAQQAAGLDVRSITGLKHIAPGENPECIDGLTFHRTSGAADGPP